MLLSVPRTDPRNGAGGTVDAGLTARPPSTACRSGSLAWRPYFVAPPEGLIIAQSLRLKMPVDKVALPKDVQPDQLSSAEINFLLVRTTVTL